MNSFEKIDMIAIKKIELALLENDHDSPGYRRSQLEKIAEIVHDWEMQIKFDVNTISHKSKSKK